MKPFLLAGPVGAGKSTLCAALMNSDDPVRKTQAMRYCGRAIDSPGEYFENPRLFTALLAEIPRAGILLYVHPADKPLTQFPPGLLRVHGKEIWAVITKCDLVDGETSDRTEEALRIRGMSRIFRVSLEEASRQPLAEALGILEPEVVRG